MTSAYLLGAWVALDVIAILGARALITAQARKPAPLCPYCQHDGCGWGDPLNSPHALKTSATEAAGVPPVSPAAVIPADRVPADSAWQPL